MTTLASLVAPWVVIMTIYGATSDTKDAFENRLQNIILQDRSMAYCKTVVTPLLPHWSYCSVALTHRDDVWRARQERSYGWRTRLLHSHSQVAVGLSVRYEILADVVTCVTGWSKYIYMHWGQFSPALNYGKLQCMWAHMTGGKINNFSIFTKGKCPPLGACKETVKQSKAGRYLCKDRNDWLTERIKRDAGKIALWLASICGACDHARLTERDLNKMVAILQTTFSNAISWMKTAVFWLKCLWNLFRRAADQLSISQH